MDIKRKTALLPIILLILFSLLLSFCTFADDDDVVTTDPESEAEPEPAPDVREFAGNIALYCIDTETMLYEKNADEICAPSASAKLMTALVAMDKIDDLDKQVEITSAMLRGTTGLIYGFSAGKSVSYDDLITAMIMRNANDAALIIARSISGSVEDFVPLMNAKAEALGMKNTVYANPTGMSDASSTTASDMLKLIMAVTENSHLLEISGRERYKLPSTGVTIYSRNYFLSSYYNGGKSYINREVLGGISGQTDESGDILLAVVKHGSYTYASVVANAERDDENIYSYLITNEIVDWGASSFTYKTLLDEFDIICDLPINMGKGADEAAVFPAKKVVRYVPVDTDLETAVTYTYELHDEVLTAPVSYSDKVGSLTLMLNGEIIETVDLILRSDVQSNSEEYMVTRAKAFLTSRSFITAVIIIVSIFAIYVLINSIVRGRKQKRLREEYYSAGSEK